MNLDRTNLRTSVRKLAELAFYQHLISGYGDGEYPDRYQITYKGKTRHLPLIQAYGFLNGLIGQTDWDFFRLAHQPKDRISGQDLPNGYCRGSNWRD
ncbi:MAG: hypothetical protein KME16_27120 [Scytolyngbya sp. HA4215-MV1]|nr:hypothetical protein [Scytolyngbya sp. HA4215-MV1]